LPLWSTIELISFEDPDKARLELGKRLKKDDSYMKDLVIKTDNAKDFDQQLDSFYKKYPDKLPPAPKQVDIQVPEEEG